MSKNTLIAPSVLAADFANLQRDIEMINNSEADWFHIDIMDGVFVPNISFGMPVLQAISKHAKKTIDVHLMIVDPDRYISTFKKLGADILTVHYEACTHLHRSLQAIKAEGMKAGVAINPHTNVSLLEDVIKDIDLVCIMSVNPGFGGQSFIENTYKKITQLKEIINRNNASTQIEIDGGVTNKNAKALVDVLLGNVNPSGKLSETFALQLEHTPHFSSFPSKQDDVLYYGDIVNNGYRYYDTHKLPVRYPFGYGLSYTTFELSNLRLDNTSLVDGDSLEVKVTVTNTGNIAGKEVVQVYVKDVQSYYQKPDKEFLKLIDDQNTVQWNIVAKLSSFL